MKIFAEKCLMPVYYSVLITDSKLWKLYHESYGEILLSPLLVSMAGCKWNYLWTLCSESGVDVGTIECCFIVTLLV